MKQKIQEQIIKEYNALDGKKVSWNTASELMSAAVSVFKSLTHSDQIEQVMTGLNKVLVAIDKTGAPVLVQVENPISLKGLGAIVSTGKKVGGSKQDEHWNYKIKLDPKFKRLYGNTADTIMEEWMFDENKFIKHFNLAAVQFGNWMSQQDRLNFMYSTARSLHNLAKVLKVKDGDMGMGGRLSIALGARGSGKARAHYEISPLAVINLTKTKGIGSLAHEYAHALDNLLPELVVSPEIEMLSGGNTTERVIEENLSSKNEFVKKMELLFQSLYMVGKKPTSFSKALDGQDPYVQWRSEVFARSFEVFVFEELKKHQLKDRFLVKGGYKARFYPSAAIIKKTPHFGVIFRNAYKLFTSNPKDMPLPGEKDKKPKAKKTQKPLNGPMAELFTSADNIKVREQNQTFRLPGDLGEFLGDLERYELAMTLDGDPGGGKSRFTYRLANALASQGDKVAIFTLEIGKESDLVQRMKNDYIAKSNLDKIFFADVAPEGIETIRAAAANFDVVIIDSWNKLDEDTAEFDRLRKDFPQTIFIAIFQRTTSGVIRGGTKPLFDAGIVIKVVKPDNDFKNNYAYCEKNRYSGDFHKYNIYSGKILREEQKKGSSKRSTQTTPNK